MDAATPNRAHWLDLSLKHSTPHMVKLPPLLKCLSWSPPFCLFPVRTIDPVTATSQF
jgi:hypothetical protein